MQFSDSLVKRILKATSFLSLPIVLGISAFLSYVVTNNVLFDPYKGEFVKYGYLHVKEISDAEVYVDGVVRGKGAKAINVVIQNDKNTFDVKIKSQDGRSWAKSVKIRDQIVTILYPVLIPDKINYQALEKAAFIIANEKSNALLYIKKENDRYKLYKIYKYSLLINSEVRNEFILDITDIMDQSSGEAIFIPGNTGNSLSIVISDKIYVLKGKEIVELKGLKPTKIYNYYWSSDDSNFVVETVNEIYSYSNLEQSPNLIYKSGSNERIELQYLDSSYIMFKVVSPDKVRLYQSTYNGSSITEVDLPNFDNIKTNNLQRVYDFSYKINSILLETDKNIYIFNPSSYEFRKLNIYEYERVFKIDRSNQIVVTQNATNKKQFRFYNIDKNESISFTIDEVETLLSPNDNLIFNYGQNLVINTIKHIMFLDSDGNNRKVFDKLDPGERILKLHKDNLNFYILKARPNEEDKENGYIIELAKFRN